MRYASNFKQPTKKEQALIRRTLKTWITVYGNGRQAALKLGINPKYFYSLLDGRKVNPGDAILRKLGLKRVTHIVEA